MTTIAQTCPVPDGFILPDDLSVYIGKKTLVKLTLDAIAGLRARAARCESPASGRPEFQPAMLLTLLTYCYATGVYASTDMVNWTLVTNLSLYFSEPGATNYDHRFYIFREK